MKKLLALTLAMIMMIFAFTACGEDTGKTPSAATIAPAPQTTAETVEEAPVSNGEWYYQGFTATIKTRFANAYDSYTVPSDINVWCDGVSIEEYCVNHIPDPEIGDRIIGQCFMPIEGGISEYGHVNGEYYKGTITSMGDDPLKYYFELCRGAQGSILNNTSLESGVLKFEVYGTDTVAGRSCTIYRHSIEMDGELFSDNRLWIDDELGCCLKSYSLTGVDGDHITHEVIEFIPGKAELPGKAGQYDQ